MLSWVQNASIGDWYKAAGQPAFEVVAIDEDAETIEIQYFDGEIEEIDFDSWAQLEVKPVAAPEDWSGPMDMERQDFDSDLDLLPTSDWRSSLDKSGSVLELQ